MAVLVYLGQFFAAVLPNKQASDGEYMHDMM
jgi:hypothetical protein